jgi:hypothetical protein
LARNIETLAAIEGYAVSQFVANAVAEKRAVMMTLNHLRRDARAGPREDFERYLPAIPNVPTPDPVADRTSLSLVQLIGPTRMRQRRSS